MGAIRKRGKQYVIQYYDAAGRRRWETIGPKLHEARQGLAERMWGRRHGKVRLNRQPITMKELSPKTVLNAMVVLKEMLKHAVQWGYLDANPAQYAERPRSEDQEMQILTPPEIRRLLDTADEPVRTLLLCAVLTGMRRGELLGLRGGGIDLEGHRIFVRRALWGGEVVTPKSRPPPRAIELAPTL